MFDCSEIVFGLLRPIANSIHDAQEPKLTLWGGGGGGEVGRIIQHMLLSG